MSGFVEVEESLGQQSEGMRLGLEVTGFLDLRSGTETKLRRYLV